MFGPIDFASIRGDNVEGQRSSFEQLVCNLISVNDDGGEFRRIDGAGGDGGVEALRILSGGQKIGYQAKYYPSRDDIDWTKLDDSVQTALTQHPELVRYVIAIPCNFTGKRAARSGSIEGIWGKWDERVGQWETWAAERGMKVHFEPWTAFELEAALLQPRAQHLIPFFFNGKVFSREWMQRHLNRTIHDLQARYSPDEHVDTESLMPFDVIYRRESVCKDLRKVFDVARGSNPRSTAALVQDANFLETDITSAEDSLKNFLRLREAVDWDTAKQWPIQKWVTSWYSLTRRLLRLGDTLVDRIREENKTDPDALERLSAETTQVYALIRDQVFGGRWAPLIPIDASRAAMFIGRAGVGKSHILARGSETAWNAGAPVIHILGQHIVDDDPRLSILKRLEIAHWSFHETLSALNLAAEAAGTRALLVIDALNEGRGTDVWRNHLASFIREVNEYDRLFLIVSCREEYMDYVVPPELLLSPRAYPSVDGSWPEACSPLGKLLPISVEGFRTSEERELALQKFMDQKGIARPTAPVLDTEFFNPLFMSSVCRAMAKAQIKVFPQGLRGSRQIFGFVLKTKAKALGTRHDGTERVHRALMAALESLAGNMVERREDHVAIHDATGVIASAFNDLPLRDQSWLAVLEGSDILRRDVELAPNEIGLQSKPKEVVRFSFQRLQDNLMAECLIAESRKFDIEGAFEQEAPFAFLVRRSVEKNGVVTVKPNPHWAGSLGALCAAIAETYGKEVFDLKSFFGSPDVHLHPRDFRPVFRASIQERAGNAFTERTRQILHWLWEDDQDDKLSIILAPACVPSHAWNVDFLTPRLLSVPLSDRDSAWSRWFARDRSKSVRRASEIIDWALNVDARAADPEVTRLAAFMLTWLFTVTNRTVRDRATKALVNLMVGLPTIFLDLLKQFRTVNDPYVLDRLLAAGYGSICLDPTNERIEKAASAVADILFESAEPPVHLSIRRWARLILEQAAERDLAPSNCDMARVRSPLGSAPPTFDLTEEEFLRIAAASGDQTIARSCHRNDFFNYVIKGSINEFSETPLTEPPPLTQDERAARFKACVREIGGDVVDKLDRLSRTMEMSRKEELRPVHTADTTVSTSMATRPTKITSEAIENAEKEFVQSLPEILRTKYETELAPKLQGTLDPARRRNAEPAGLWIGHRAYQLGWTKKLFPDEPYSGDSGRPVIERVGKKYQWIALEELMARLSDNYWMRNPTRTGVDRYRHDICHIDSIDPTIFPPRAESYGLAEDFVGPPPLFIENTQDCDLHSWPFLGDHFDSPECWLTGLFAGRKWLIADFFDSSDEPRSENNLTNPLRRQVQAFVSLVAHPAGDRERIVDAFIRNESRGIGSWSLMIEPEGFLAHEFRLLGPEVIPFWKFRDHGAVRMACPILTGYAATDTDRSIKGSIKYTVPHPRIFQKLALSIPDSRDTGLWLLPNGQVFLRALPGRGSPLLLDKGHFDDWCQSEDLDYTWVYVGERTAWLDTRAVVRRTAGAAWFEKEKIHFRNYRPYE